MKRSTLLITVSAGVAQMAFSPAAQAQDSQSLQNFRLKPNSELNLHIQSEEKREEDFRVPPSETIRDKSNADRLNDAMSSGGRNMSRQKKITAGFGFYSNGEGSNADFIAAGKPLTATLTKIGFKP